MVFGTNVLCALNVLWRGDGWSLDVNPVSNPNQWNAGNVVVARYSYNFPSLLWRVFG